MYAFQRDMSNSSASSILLKAKRFGIFSVFAITANIFTIPQAAYSQIAVDGSTATEVKGNVISPTGSGTVNGGNLYNSFQEFNVPTSGVIFNTGNSSVDGSKINNLINRVTGENPSSILGTIESRQAFPNANLYLLNPNGVIFSPNARLDIGGSFNVSTGTGLGFDQNQKFTVDKNSLSFPSGDPKNIQFAISQPAGIINQGNLSVDAGKNIAITAGTVINAGNLTAPNGNVSLAAVAGNSQVELRSPDLVLGLSVSKDAIPSNWNGAIASLPKLAESLTGKAAEANQVVVKPDGSIALVTNPSSSDIAVKEGMAIASGIINVSSESTRGGNVGIFGNQVGLVNAQVNASGATGGGTVLIGGDFQGKGVAPNALQTYIDASSKILANGLLTGDGGKVIIWADRSTQFFGAIAARGGETSGNGGFVEVSGKENLSYQGNTDTRAPNGKTGTLLLDPFNITVANGVNTPAQLTANDQFADFFPPPLNTINNGTINSATANVVLQAINDIRFNAPINVIAPGIGITAQAGGSIEVSSSITTNVGNVSLTANDNTAGSATNSGNITISAPITTNGGAIAAQINNAGGLTIIDSNLQSGGGDISLSANTVTNFTLAQTAILITQNTTIDALGGDIAIAGISNSTANGTNGVLIRGNIQTNNTGSISITGDSGVGPVNQRGILLDTTGSKITVVDGNISITGTSRGTSFNNEGIQLRQGVTISATGAGNISLTGTGNNDNTTGILIFDQPIASLSTVTGNITLTGITGANSTNTQGINIDLRGNTGSTPVINSTNGGSISLIGTGETDISLLNVTLGSNDTGIINFISNSGRSINLSGTVISPSIQNYIGNVLLFDNTILNSINGIINLNGDLNSGIVIAPLPNLTINSGSGIVNFNGSIGSSQALGDITVNNLGTSFFNNGDVNSTSLTTDAGGTTQLRGNITTTGNQTFNDSISLNSPVSLVSNNGSITLNADVTGNQSLTLSAGNVTLGAIGNSTQPIGDLTIFGGTNTFNNPVFADTIEFFGNGNNSIINADLTGINNLKFDNNSFTINGNVSFITDNIEFAGGAFASGNGNLTITPFSPSLPITIGGNGIGTSGTLSLDNSDLSAFSSGTLSSLTIGNATNQSNISLTGNASFAQPTTIQSPAGNGTINASGFDLNNTGGSITLLSNQNITTGNITAAGNAIAITSTSGAINTSLGTINTSVANGTGGNILLQAINDIKTGNLFSDVTSNGNGGLISITTNGSIDTSLGQVDSRALGTSGDSGNISYQAVGNITTANVVSESRGDGNGGLISLITTNGSIDTSLGQVDSRASGSNGTGGNITYQATGNILTRDIVSVANVGNGGQIAITSTSGAIDISLGTVITGVVNGTGGSITISAADTIKTSAVNSSSVNGNGGDIAFNASGSIDTSLGTVQSDAGGSGNTGTGGRISYNSTNGNITTGIVASNSNQNSGNGGEISLSAAGDIITTANLLSGASNGNGGLISLITTNGSIDTSLGSVLSISFGANGNGGNIVYQAIGNIQTSAIGASANGNGNGGLISLITANGSIDTTSGRVDSVVAGSGTGGDIKFQATGNITTSDALAYANNGNAGKISFSTSSGTIDTSQGLVQSYSNNNGNGGNITYEVNTTGNIRTGQVINYAISNGNGGNISFKTVGDIDTSLGEVIANGGTNGNSGNIVYEATGNITTGNITSLVGTNGNGGFISLNTLGDIQTNEILSLSFGNGNTGEIILTSINGSISTDAVDTSSNGVNGNAANITFDAQNGNVSTGNRINANTTSTNISSTAGSLTINALNTTNIGNINLSANAGTAGDINLNGNLSLTASKTFSTTSGGIAGNIDLDNAIITGSQSLTLNSGTGNVALGSVGTSLVPLTDLTVTSGNTTLNNNIFTANALNFNTPVVLSSDVSLNTTNSAIAFNDTINGNQALSLNAGTGSIFFNGIVGDVSPLASLAIAPTSTLTSINNLDITTVGNITTGNIFNSGRDIALTSTLGAIDTSLGQISTTATTGNAGNISYQAAGNITTGGISTFADTGNAGNISLNTSSGTIITGISFLDSTSNAGNGGDITINATNGNIATSSVVFARTGSTNPLSTAGSISFDALNLAIAGNLDSSAIAGTAGNITLKGNLPLTLNLSFITSSNTGTSGNINLANASITGNQALTLNADTGNVALGSIGNTTTPLNSLSISSGNITLNNDIFTANGLSFSSPVGLANNVLLSTNTGGITFGNTINGNQSLSLNSGSGNVIFFGAIGTTTNPLGNLIVNSSGTDIFNSSVNAASLITNASGITQIGGNVITTGAQTYNDAVRLVSPIQLNTTNSAIAFNSSVNGNQSFTLNSGTGNITFGGAVVGSTTLTANSAGITRFNSPVNSAASITTDALGTTELNGNVTTSGTQTYNDIVNLTNTAQLNTTNSAIAFNDTVDGNQSLSLNAGTSSIFFNGIVGGISPLVSLAIAPTSTLTSINNLDITAVGNITTGNISNSGRNIAIISNNGNIDTSAGSIDTSISIGNGGDVLLQALDNITVRDVTTESLFGNAGDISLISLSGGINTSTGFINSRSSDSGNGGNIFLQAQSDINTAGLSSLANSGGASSSNGNSGNISLISNAGNIDTSLGRVESEIGFGSGDAGDILLRAIGNITTSDVIARILSTSGNGGQISLITAGGEINANGVLYSYSNAANGGDILLQSAGDITVSALGGVLSSSVLDGGDISLVSSSGTIDTTLSEVNSSSSSIGNAGDILFQTTGNISTQNVIATAANGDGGNVSLITTNGTVNTTFLSATTISADPSSKAGSVTLNTNNLEIGGGIDVSAANGIGSNFAFSGNLLLLADTTISTAGLAGNGNINLANANITGNQTLFLNSGSGNVALGSVGTSLAPLPNLNVTSGNTTLSNDIFTNNAVNFDNPVSLLSNISINTTNGAIAFNNDITGNQDLTINSGTNNITFGGTTTVNNLIANSTGTTRFNTVNAGSLLTDVGGTTELNGNVNTTGAATFNDVVNLLSAIQFNTGGAIAFNNNLTGNQDLTLNSGANSITFGGTTTVNNLIANSTGITRFNTINAASLLTNVGGTTEFTGNVNTTGTATFNDAVNLLSAIQFNTGGAIAFNNTVSGNQDLTLNSGTNNITFGDTTTVNNLIANSTGTNRFNTVNASTLLTDAGGTTELNGTINTSGTQTYNDAVTLLGEAQLNANNNAVLFNTTVDGTQNLIVSTGSGDVTFNGAVGSSTILNNLIANSTGVTRLNNSVNAASLFTNAGGTTELNGNITTTGTVNFNDAVNLLSAIQFNSGGATVFNNDVNGNQALSLNAGTNSIFFNSIVGGVTPLASLAIAPTSNLTSINNLDIKTVGNITTGNITNQGRDISLTSANGTIKTTFLSTATISADPNSKAGLITLNTNNLEIGGGIDASAANGSGSNFEFSGNLLLLADTTISTAGLAGSGNINLANANITGNQTLFLNAGNGNIALGEIGSSTNAITGISFTSSDTILSKDVFVNGSLDFRNPVTLTNDVTVNSSNIVFRDTVNGSQSLILNAGTGNITFDGGVGTITALENITANSGGITRFSSNVNAASLTTDAIGTTEINGNILTSGSQTFNDAVNLTNAVQLTTTNSAIAFNNTVNGTQNLAINSGNADINFNGAVGDSTPLANLLISGAEFVRFASNVNADSLTISGATLSSNGSIVTTSNIAIGDIINSGNPLFLTSNVGSITTGNIRNTPPNSGNGSNVTVDANNDVNTGNIATDSASFTGGNILLRSRTGQIVAGNVNTSGNVGGSVFFDASTAIAVGAINSSGTTRAGDVTLDPLGDVVVSSIDASSPLQAGNVTLISTGGGLRITDLINSSISSACFGSSICTSGAIAGNISLQTGGVSSFIVGDSSINGSTGRLTTGFNTISVGTTILVRLGSQFTTGDATSGIISISPGFILAQNSNSTNEGSKFIPPTASEDIITIDNDESRLLAITEVLKDKVDGYFKEGDLESAFETIEGAYTSELDVFTGKSTKAERARITIENTQDLLSTVTQQTGDAAVLIYPVLLKDRIEILVIPPSEKGNAFRATSSILNQESAQTVIAEYRNNLRDVGSNDYLEQSQKLYDWIIRPVEKKLEGLKIDTLVFVMDGDLRVSPPAAFHDGKQFLIERYAIANIPTLRALRLEQRDRKTTRVLAMGLTESVEGFSALPSVDIEIKTISSEVLNGVSFLNQDFTVNNLQKQRQGGTFNILHLGTHAKFVSDTSKDSFIQFWDSRLKLSEIPQLRFDNPAIDMLALSACQTAVGNNLGISGLAVESGAKSVLASLWEVSDAGTAPLMISFYKAFPDAVNKAQAMKTAQLALLGGKVKIGDSQILGIEGFPSIPLPAGLSDIDLSHPFYWSSFILVGNWL